MSSFNLNQVSHFVLQKHHLTDDSKIDDIVQIVLDIGGLHATGSTTPYLSLFSRMKDFSRDKLDEELYIKRTLGKIRCVRKTVYVLPKEWISIAFNATKTIVASISEPHLFKYLGVTQKEYETTSRKIMKILKTRGMTVKEIKHEIGLSINISGIVNLMCDQMLLIRGKPQKGWKSNLHTYYLFHEFFPDVNLNLIEEDESKEFMIKKYIDSFGPVTENDIIWWTGFPKGQIKTIIDSFQNDLSIIEIKGIADDFLISRSDEMHLSSINPTHKPIINLLPSLDPYIMGYKIRERYLYQKYYNYVFDRSGNATFSILLNGNIIGVWDVIESYVKIFIFQEINNEILQEIHKKAKKIGTFFLGKNVKVKECKSMVPLTERTAGSVMSTLKDQA